MSFAHESMTLHGSCHCGRIKVEFSTCREPANISPRACDCSFCRKHGAAYVSDPAGKLRLTVTDPGSLRSYRQGAELARFQSCGVCGVLVAVIFEHAGRLHGAVNVACLDGNAVFGAVVCASPQLLSPEAKVARWLQAWVPDVQLTVAGA